MNLNLDNLAIFVAIADAGGFTAAARTLGLPKSTVSRRLSEFERSLGITLFNRSTRSLSLTDEGAHYYSNAKPVVDAAIEVGRSMAQPSAEPSGLVRLTATAAIGQYLLAPALHAFLERYPEVKVELRLTDSRVNLIEEGFDLAIRMGALEDSQLVARRLTAVTLLVVAAPDFIARSGTPNHPSDLANLDCLVLEKKLSTWHFADELQVPVRWRLATGNMLLARDAALSGRGFALLPDFMVAEDLVGGRLVRLLPGYPTPSVTASMVSPRQRYRSLAIRKLMEHFVDWHDVER